ncbi:hypothetical protein F5Y19DRAFT_465880 [Xylariaceae sp. FL1651]|nr:hypothetical protein F5Y19DRAFT_465880 [Xylariaceae sp. FL1651]
MADASYASASTTTVNATTPGPEPPSTSNAPTPGFVLRRAATMGQPSQMRRRMTGNNPPPTAENTFANLRRRSSTYSDYLETSADELLNPGKSSTGEVKKSPFVYVPLTLALLPAVAGIFFENGAAFFTDLILLSLAAVFLHWSVTQPWDWYHSAQQVRVMQDEILADSVFESDSEPESISPSTPTTLENVPEEKEKDKETYTSTKDPVAGRNAKWQRRQAAAVKELYIHEILALVWCFIFPMLGAYLLHAIRGQLSRPSEGLVSDYNLTIFLCAAEVRPVSHLIRMIQKRTLHVQQIVAHNPHIKQAVTNDQVQALHDRLDELEARASTREPSVVNGAQPEVPQTVVESAVGREFRKSIQSEIEALSRAMRRYEKKLTLLASQTDHGIEYVDCRLNDAIALAAMAAKNSNSQWALTSWLIEKIATGVMLPLQAVAAVLMFPFRTAMTMFRWKSKPTSEKGLRPLRNGKLPAQGRGNSDRIPARVSRR